MAATLWATDLGAASDTLDLLLDESLLLPGVPATIAGQTCPTYRVHDLFHDLARARLISGAIAYRGSPIATLPQAHGALLDRYQTLTRGGLWSTLPDDGYIHLRLPWHMDKAQQPDLIHALLQEETPDGRNAWFEAQDRLGQPAVFLTHVAQAWSLADHAAAHPGPPSIALGHQVRYALIISSLNSLASNIPGALILALLQSGRWTSAQALAYALRRPDPAARADALAALAPHLPPAAPGRGVGRRPRHPEGGRWRSCPGGPGPRPGPTGLVHPSSSLAIYPLRPLLRRRDSLLADLAALAPITHRLGGPAAQVATAHAIIDVTRWWP